MSLKMRALCHRIQVCALAAALCAAIPLSAQGADGGSQPSSSGGADLQAAPPRVDRSPTTGKVDLPPREESAKAPVSDEVSASKDDSAPTFFGTFVRMVLALCIILAAVYLTLNFGLRRLMQMRSPTSGPDGMVQVVDRIPLDQRRMMYVVRAGAEYLLVGGGDAGLSLITRLDAAEVAQRLAARPTFLDKMREKSQGSKPS